MYNLILIIIKTKEKWSKFFKRGKKKKIVNRLIF